jgi:hypothetical protein
VVAVEVVKAVAEMVGVITGMAAAVGILPQVLQTQQL